MILKLIIPILGLGLVIAFHELGHLMAAKLLKIKVDVFSIGMGKKLLSIKKNGTEYALSLIPIGGYCKLKGGDIRNPIKDKDSIDVAHPIKKILIFIAGPIFNIILASIIMTIYYIIPAHEITPNNITPIMEQEFPAELAGLKSGDKIIEINGESINTYDDIVRLIKGFDPINFIIQRDEKIIDKTITPKDVNGRPIIGIYPLIPLTVKNKIWGSNLKPSDTIVSINSVYIDNFHELQKELGDEKSYVISVIRGTKKVFLTVTKRELLDVRFTDIQMYSIIQSIAYGNRDTYLMLKQIVTIFGNLFKSGEIKNQVSSPIGLVYEVGNSINNVYSVQNKLFTLQIIISIIASISLTLGFINILPIPILDGGQILINLIIIIKGKSFKASFLYGYQTIGLIIVLLLFVLGINNDLLKFWRMFK